MTTARRQGLSAVSSSHMSSSKWHHGKAVHLGSSHASLIACHSGVSKERLPIFLFDLHQALPIRQHSLLATGGKQWNRKGRNRKKLNGQEHSSSDDSLREFYQNSAATCFSHSLDMCKSDALQWKKVEWKIKGCGLINCLHIISCPRNSIILPVIRGVHLTLCLDYDRFTLDFILKNCVWFSEFMVKKNGSYSPMQKTKQKDCDLARRPKTAYLNLPFSLKESL